ncbi:unnamed protein product [Cunninghamella blakesleeana]
MHPLVWISLIGSGIALAIISSIEAKNYYERHRDQWEYEQYIRDLRRNYRKDFGLPSDSEDNGDDDDEDNRPLSSIRDQQGFRQRKNRQNSSTLNNDEQWYQEAEIELSRMEEKIVERKRRLEMEHSLLEKAEMDLERRRHEISTETNNLLKSKLSELSQNQPSSSTSSSIHSNSDSFHPSLFSSAHQIPPPLPPLPTSLSSSISSSYHPNINNTSIHSEQRNMNNSDNIINYQSDNQSKSNDNHSTTSPFVSVASFSSNQTALKQPMDNSTLSLPQEPWAFEDDDDDDNESNTNNVYNNNNNNNNMKFPNTINQIDDRHSEISWNTVSSQQHSTSILNSNADDNDDNDDNLSNFSLHTPAAPSEDGASSYDMLSGSDVDSHH